MTHGDAATGPAGRRAAGPRDRGATAPGRVPDRVTEARDWFRRDALEVARDLLGSLLVRRTPAGTVAIRITEVEAYRGSEDPASHAYRGPTARNAVMFGDAGHLYVYRHLGLHHCANVVAGEEGIAQAVLLRAGEVVDGADLARDRRLAAGVCRTDRDLARGPARLAVAADLTRADDGADVVGHTGAGPRAGSIVLLPGPRLPDSAVACGPRVGVSGAGAWAAGLAYRFWVAGDPHVSAYRR